MHIYSHKRGYKLIWVHGPLSVTPIYSVLFKSSLPSAPYTVYPKKYAHGFCFAVLCSGYTLTDFPISIRLTSLALWQSNDCPSASKATLMNMDRYFMWIHYERLHNHNKAKHNKTVCIFLGIYCMRQWSGSVLIRIMVYRLCSAKPLTEPTLTYCPSGTNFREIWIEMQNMSFIKLHLKMSSAKYWTFCLGEIINTNTKAAEVCNTTSDINNNYYCHSCVCLLPSNLTHWT